MKFKDYAYDVLFSRTKQQGYYDYYEVEKNFHKVIDTLGYFDKRDLIVKIDLQIMNKYGSWDVVDKVCSALRIKVSQYFLGRKSKYCKLPFVRSIEEKEQTRGFIKNHAHILIRLKDLKQYYDEKKIVDTIEKMCYSMNEVNSKQKHSKNPPVNIRLFPYWEEKNKDLGSAIEYICKTSTKTNNPLERGLYSH